MPIPAIGRGFAVEVVNLDEWLVEDVRPTLQTRRLTQFVTAFPEVNGVNTTADLRPHRWSGLSAYHGALRSTIALIRDVAGGVGGAIERTVVRMEDAAEAHRQRTLRVELRLPTVVDVPVFEFSCPPVKGCRVEVSSSRTRSVAYDWSLSSVGITRSRGRTASVSIGSIHSALPGERFAITARMHAVAVFAMQNGVRHSATLEFVGRDNYSELWRESMPQDKSRSPGELIMTYRERVKPNAEPATYPIEYSRTGYVAVRCSGELRAVEGLLAATSVRAHNLRLSMTLAPGHVYYLHRTPAGNGVMWKVV